MSVIIPDEVLQAARMSADELKQGIAILLFEKGELIPEQANRPTGLSQLRLQHRRASRPIPIYYDLAEFEADLTTRRETGRP